MVPSFVDSVGFLAAAEHGLSSALAELRLWRMRSVLR